MKNTKSFGLGILGLVAGILFTLFLGAFIKLNFEAREGLFLPLFLWLLDIIPLITSFWFSTVMFMKVNK